MEGLDCTHGTINAFYSTEENPASSLDDSIVEVPDGRKVVKDGCFMVKLYVRH